MGDRSEVNRELLYAVREGNLEKIQNLIDNYGLSYLPDRSEGYVLLREATERNQTEVAKLLLRNDCRVNSKSGNPSMTPLHFAANNDDFDVVQMLLDKGAYVDMNDGAGRTPFIIAVERGNSLFAAHLSNRGASVHIAPSSSNYSGRTLLHIARKNNDKIVETLLCNHAYVNATDRNGATPLHDAVEHGNLKLVEWLLIYGADIDSTCISGRRKGYTALHVAAQTGNEEMIKLLLSKGSSIDARTGDKSTPLHVAAQTGNEEIIKLLLSKGSTIDARTEDDSTPLHIAIKHAREAATRIYLEHGADVNAKSVDNQTPLNLAVEKSSLTIIREVLRYKPDSSDEYNRLALCSAVRKYGRDSEKIVADLLDYGLAVSPQDIIDGSLLYAAVEKGYEKIVEDLLKYGADANYSGPETWSKSSLLHITAREGRDSITKLLINYGADVNSKDSNGRTPIYLAIQNGNLEVVKQLLNNNAYSENSFDLLRLAIESSNTKIVEILLCYNVNVNAVNKNGVSALHIAVKRNDTEMVKLLLDYRADINSVSKSHMTPLHVAASTGSESITTMILNKGANINAALENGVTALYMACVKGHNNVVEILLKSGAELNYEGKNGGVLLHAAAQKGHAEVVKVLLRYDADIDFKNDKGVTALHIASKKEFVDVLDILLKHGSDINSMTKSKYTALDLAIFSYQFHSATLSYHSDLAAAIDICEDPDERTIEYLQRHLIKLRAANLYLNEKNIRSIDSYKFWHFCTDCEKEIENMKSQKISNDISFYDILTKGISKLSAYARNENVMQALTTDEYKTKFPIYASMINLQFQKGLKRNDLLEQTNRFFDSLSCSFPVLPHPCVDKILTYLSNHDLRNLINASKATDIE